MRVTQFFLLLGLVLFSGCNNNNSGTKAPYLMGQKPAAQKISTPITKSEERIVLTAMQAKHQEALATIAAKKETRLRQLDLEKSKSADLSRQKIIASENQRKITIEKEKQKSAIIIERERSALYQQYLIAGVILFMLLALLIYIIHRRNQALKLKVHEEELRHKEYMLAHKLQHERVAKTLEILADQSTDKTLKKELVKLLKDQGTEQPKLLS